MQCSVPPPLSDDDLSAVIDGTRDPAVADHLAQCPACTARLEAARQLEQRLYTALYRWDCPTAQELGDYAFELVPPEVAEQIGAHVAHCPRCRAELAELSAFLAVDAEPQPVEAAAPPPLPRLGDLIARLVPRPLALATRGADSGPLVAEADGLTIFLSIQPTAKGRALTGQIVSEDQAQWTGALVEIRQGGALHATATLDDLGSFRCEPFPLALTDLIVIAPTGNRVTLREVDFSQHES